MSLNNSPAQDSPLSESLPERFIPNLTVKNDEKHDAKLQPTSDPLKGEDATEWQGIYEPLFIKMEKNTQPRFNRVQEDVQSLQDKKTMEPYLRHAIHIFQDDWTTVQRHDVVVQRQDIGKEQTQSERVSTERRGSVFDDKEDVELEPLKKSFTDPTKKDEPVLKERTKDEGKKGLAKIFGNLKKNNASRKPSIDGALDTPIPKKSNSTVLGEEMMVREHPAKYPYSALFDKKVASKIKKLNEDARKLLPEDTVIEKEEPMRTNLFTLLRPNWKYVKADLTMCERTFKAPSLEKKPLQFRLNFNPPDFEHKLHELYFITAALYDVSQGTKLSEDFHFHIPTVTQPIPQSLQNELQKSESRCLFTVSAPTTTTYMFVLIERVLLGNYADAILPYSKKLQQTDKNKLKNAFSKSEELSHYRQPLMWGFTKLFVPADGASLDAEVIPGKLIEGQITLDTFFKVPSDAKRVEIIDLITLKKGNAVEDLDKKYGKIEGQMQIDVSLNPTEETLVKRVSMKKRSSRYYEKPVNLSSDPESYPSVEEFPSQPPLYPHLNYFNNLYLYPHLFKFGDKIKPNVAVHVAFKSNDLSIKENSGEKRVASRYDENLCMEFGLSSVTQGSKTPWYYDEIKIDLPAQFHDKHHLLFTFYNVDTEAKPVPEDPLAGVIGSAKREVLGFAFVKITEGDYLFTDKIRTLEVYKALQTGYLSIDKKKLELTKHSFDFKTKLNSSIYPAESNVKNLYVASQKIEKTLANTKEMDDALKMLIAAFKEFPKLKFDVLMPYLPVIINTIHHYLTSVGKLTRDATILNDISEQGMIALVSTVKGACNVIGATPGKRIPQLTSIVQYLALQNPDHAPLFTIYSELLTKFITSPPNTLSEGDRTSSKKEDKKESLLGANDVLACGWFFFDVILKSIALTYEKTLPTKVVFSVDDKGVVPSETAQEFGTNLIKLIQSYMKQIFMTTTSTPETSKLANRHLALFLRDLYGIIDKASVDLLIDAYLDTIKNTDTNSIFIRLEFFQIFVDHDCFIGINYKDNKYVSIFVKQIFDGLNNLMLREKSLYILVNHFYKIDFDSRLANNSEARQAVAKIYWPFIEVLLDKPDALNQCYTEDELVGLTSIFVWILSNCNQKFMLDWFKSQGIEFAIAFWKVMEASFLILWKKRKNLVSEPKQEERNLDPCVNINIITDYVVANTKEYILSLHSQGENIHPLMDQICHFYMSVNVTCSNLVKIDDLANISTIQGEVAIRYDNFAKLRNFLTLYMDLIVVKEKDLENVTSGKKVLLAKLETRWKWLAGAVVANTTHPVSLTHPSILECKKIIMEPFDQQLDEKVKEPLEFGPDDFVIDEKTELMKAATIEKLVEMLFNEAKEKNYDKMFLLTYFSFTTPSELLVNFLRLYYFFSTQTDKQVVEIKILNFMVEWCKNSFHNFDNYLINQLVKFIDDADVAVKFKGTHEKLKRGIFSKLVDVSDISDKTAFKAISQPPEVPKDFVIQEMEKPKYPLDQVAKFKKTKMFSGPFDYQFDILAWSSAEIAKQLTLIEMDLFKQIEPKECFGLGWSKANKLDLAPNIVAISERFNKVNDWVTMMIMKEKDTKTRQALLTKFIDIAKHCRELQNYVTLNQITSALNSASVYRMQKTTWSVLKPEELNLFTSASQLFQKPPYNELRQELKSNAGNPTVPFIGVYLTELTFIEDGNPNNIEYKNKKLINMFKRRLYSETLFNIQLYQQNVYAFTPLPYLNYIFTNEIFQQEVWDEKTMYAESLKFEPRSK